MGSIWVILFGACTGITFAQWPSSGTRAGMGGSFMNPLMMSMLLSRDPPDVPDRTAGRRLPSMTRPRAGMQGVPRAGMQGVPRAGMQGVPRGGMSIGSPGVSNNPLTSALLANKILATRLQMLLLANALNIAHQREMKTTTNNKAQVDALMGGSNNANGVVASNSKIGTDTIHSAMSEHIAANDVVSELSGGETSNVTDVFRSSKKNTQIEPGHTDSLNIAALSTSQTISSTKETLSQTKSNNVKKASVLEQPTIDILIQQMLAGQDSVANSPTNIISNTPVSTSSKSTPINQQPSMSPLMFAQLLLGLGQQRSMPNLNIHGVNSNMNRMMMRGSTGLMMSDFLDHQVDMMTEMGGLGMGFGGMGMMGGGGMGLGMEMGGFGLF